MKTWIALIIVFISGVVIGIVGTLLFVKSAVLQIMSGDLHRVTKMIVNRIDAKLDLNSQQKQEVTGIVNAANEELAAFREKHRPEIEAIIKKHAERIRLILNDKQKQAFAQMVEKFKRIRLKRGG